MTKDPLDLTGKRAFVTGASRGIGYGIADMLAEHGASVCIAALHGDLAAAAADKITASLNRRDAAAGNADIFGIGMDVTSTASVAAGFAAVEDRWGGLDILVNNAGVANSVDFADLDESAWDRVLDTNLKGTYRCCRSGLALMGRGGTVVNIASISGSMVNVPQFQANYNASKAGVIHLTKSLAVEYAPRDIRINSLSPGYTLTDMNRRPEVQSLVEVWKNRTPMGRLAGVEEIASAALFLASPMSGFITGHDLVADGGITVLC